MLRAGYPTLLHWRGWGRGTICPDSSKFAFLLVSVDICNTNDVRLFTCSTGCHFQGVLILWLRDVFIWSFCFGSSFRIEPCYNKISESVYRGDHLNYCRTIGYIAGPGSGVGWAFYLYSSGHEFEPRSGHISFLESWSWINFYSHSLLLLTQVGQLSVPGERVDT